jgi:hypothetical protein
MESELDVLFPELPLGCFTAVKPFYDCLDTLDVLDFVGGGRHVDGKCLFWR